MTLTSVGTYFHGFRIKTSILGFRIKTSILLFCRKPFCSPNFEKNINFAWKGEVRNACSDFSYSRGVTILFSENFKGKILNTEICETGRTLLINLEYNNKIFTVVSIYAPDCENNRIEFFKQLRK